jgi:hypothetical protein
MEPLARPEGWMTGLPLDISDDGIVGLVRNFDGPLMTYRWDAPDTTSLLPMLPGWIRAWGGAVTSDGASIIGTATLGDGTARVVRWTGLKEPEVLPLPDGATSASSPNLDAADNIYAVAFFGPQDQRLVRWRGTGTDVLTPLPYPSEFHGVSADGSTFLLKSLHGSDQEELLVWTAAGGFSSILYANSPLGFSMLTAVMADGSVVFGQHALEDGDGDRVAVFAWTRDGGVVSTSKYLADLGVDLTGWTDIAINDVSADGARLVGGAIRLDGRAEAILIDLIGFCTADFNDDGGINSQDLFDFLTAFFGADPVADINADGTVNSQDFFDFLAAFFDGCN